MFIRPPLTILAFVASVTLLGCNEEQQAQVSYKSDIKPLIDGYCAECHTGNGKGTKASGFAVDSYESLMKGTKYGPVIVAGAPLSSTLYRLVSGKTDASIQMPHSRDSLKANEVRKIELWIEQGAKNI